ncbi:asparagine synthase [Desulfonema ishimotonii]|uniref:asparagine synthase (glutamine-hydrolyzing) n=1 Tax=Desulfonema ishimotonii TaxID=45657 RepID=A0A401FQI0_9BACT|nr:asparagine synthase (glutamine-hydrolyzing) [Desulfonema ishimotonii]GBC59248.1 asparagine synthase [Desulfonema ishimotonii]
MCGIVGILNKDARPVDPAILGKMTDTLIHRGPDDEGYYINSTETRAENAKWKKAAGRGNVGLGQRRLSIIDLSGGHQPMTNEDHTVWISFNGEIYNFQELKKELVAKGHQFRTNSDTEAIIHGYEEWGKACVSRLRGMFAFAIWDENRKRLFMARDRLGIKPLYYYTDNTKFLFGSEIKAIVAHPDVRREVSPKALYDYLCLMYIPAPGSIFKGIHKLPAGHTLTVEDGKISIEEYWDLHFSEVAQFSESEWCERIVHKLRESTDIRMISEVPLGAFLSGGVDSSAVVALMASLQETPVQTASIGFGEKKFDELPYAREIVRKYHTDHHEMTVSPDATGILDKLVWHYDEPFADSSAIPTWYVSQVARQKVTVALSGDGGDENFAGYRRYYFDRLENRIRGIFPDAFRRNIIGPLARLYPKADRLPRMFRGKTLLTNLAMDPAEGFYNSMSWFQAFRKDILSPGLRAELDGYDPVSLFRKYYDRADSPDPLSRIQYIDIKTYLVDDILTKVDRASMAHALEVRVPVLDHEFMELVATMPSGLKLKGKDAKYIFKKALKPLVPHGCLYRKKMGFSIPLGQWLRTELRPVFEQQVFGSDGFVANYLDRGAVRRLWEDHKNGTRDFAYELWSILFLEAWGRKWVM